MRSVKYDKTDIINLIKLNAVALFGGNMEDYYIDIKRDSATLTRRDKKPITIQNLWLK